MGEGSGNRYSMNILLVKTGSKAAACIGLGVYFLRSLLFPRYFYLTLFTLFPHLVVRSNVLKWENVFKFKWKDSN